MIRVLSEEEARERIQGLIDQMQAALNDPKKSILINPLSLPLGTDKRLVTMHVAIGPKQEPLEDWPCQHCNSPARVIREDGICRNCGLQARP